MRIGTIEKRRQKAAAAMAMAMAMGISPSESSGSPIFKCLRSRVVYKRFPKYKPRRSSASSTGHLNCFDSLGFKWTTRKNSGPPNRAITEAFNYYNQISDAKYEMLNPGSVTPVGTSKGLLYHVDFTARKTDNEDAPVERFFAELTRPTTAMVLSATLRVRLCVCLGPINSTIAGDRLNGCFYCRQHNNVWHPKGGGFSRGADRLYKTLQDIVDIADVDQEKHLTMLEEVSRAGEPKKESEYASQPIDDASLYATEVMKFINQRDIKNYEPVNRGFGTRVILPKCSLLHINFKVKETDPMAPEKLFFAELTCTNGVLSVKHCRELSPAELMSGDVTGDKTNGCYYCSKFNKVRHPSMGGFVRGGDSLYIADKESFCY